MYKDKDVNISLLLDFYGELLPEHQREAMEYYYNDDMSLSEISDNIGISRQGVRDRIVKGERTLSGLEEKLGLVSRFNEIKKDIELISERACLIGDNEISEAAKRVLGKL